MNFTILKRTLFLKNNSKVISRLFSSILQEVKVDRLSGKQEGILTINLNKPETKNALSKSLVNTLHSIIGDIANDHTARVVIFRSLVPGAFCAGADLKERISLNEQEVEKFVKKLRNLTIKIEELPIPVIAAIDGVALGGGLEIALACDIRTSSEEVKMGLVETKLAIIPGAGGTQRLPRILNPSLAKELIFTAKTISGAEAMKLGIVNHVVKQNETNDSAYKKALELAEKILLNGPISIRMAKKAINKGIEVDIASGYVIEEACYAQIIPTKDRLEGLNAFIEKRQPIYKNK